MDPVDPDPQHCIKGAPTVVPGTVPMLCLFIKYCTWKVETHRYLLTISSHVCRFRMLVTPRTVATGISYLSIRVADPDPNWIRI